MTRALIVGCNGQDGHYLTALLGQRDYQVTGVARDGVYKNGKRSGSAINICDGNAMEDLVASSHPDEIYFLVAYHHSSDEEMGEDTELFRMSFATHVEALLILLEAIRKKVPRARLFYAGSSLVFGNPSYSPQTEETPQKPTCVYGITKTAGMSLCSYYRYEHNLFCSSGILYSHESPKRPSQFVSQRIVQTAKAIAEGKADKLVIGDPEAVIEWGYAPDYVKAMNLIVQLDEPDDFIVASGRPRILHEYIDAVFAAFDIPIEGRIHKDSSILVRKPRMNPLVGDYTKLNLATGWQPEHNLEEIAKYMVAAESDQ